MKALWMEGPEHLEYGDLPDPEPEPGWVRIHVKAATVCGGDMNIYRNGRPGVPLYRRVSGHEFAGVVDKTGEGVDNKILGRRVTVYPQIYCGMCPSCRAGDYNVCEHRGMIGGRTHNGGFAEYVTVPEKLLISVPEKVLDHDAAMTEPFAVGLHAARRAGGEKLHGKNVVIYGAGPIALFAMESVRYFGAKQIIMLDLEPEKLRVAAEHGASHTLEARLPVQELISRVRDWTEGLGADAVIDAVCRKETVDNAMHFCRPHGTVTVVGLSQSDFSVNFRYLIDHEITLQGAYLYTSEMRECLDLQAQGKISVGYIADPIYPLSRGIELFRKLDKNPQSCWKGMLLPDAEYGEKGL